MAIPNRMPRYDVQNSGNGPFAVFYCETCGRSFNSQPMGASSAIEDAGKQVASNILGKIPIVGETLASSVNQSDLGIGKVEEAGKQAVGNFLERIPILGESLAQSVVGASAHGNTLTPQQIEMAWSQVSYQFRQCPTCGKVVCLADFDEQHGVCRSHTGMPGAAPSQPGQYGASAAAPQQGQYGQYDAPPVAPPVQGQYGQYDTPTSSAQAGAQQGQYGQYDTPPAAPAGQGQYGQYDTPSSAPGSPPAADPSMARCPKDGTQAPAGTKFCPNCGSLMVQPAPPAAVGTICANCGADTKGANFCPNCGAKQVHPAPTGICPNCGTDTKGAHFCPNCGNKMV